MLCPGNWLRSPPWSLLGFTRVQRVTPPLGLAPGKMLPPPPAASAPQKLEPVGMDPGRPRAAGGLACSAGSGGQTSGRCESFPSCSALSRAPCRPPRRRAGWRRKNTEGPKSISPGRQKGEFGAERPSVLTNPGDIILARPLSPLPGGLLSHGGWPPGHGLHLLPQGLP